MKLSKAALMLLEAVKDGRVYQSRGVRVGGLEYRLETPGSLSRKVTKRVEALLADGYVTVGSSKSPSYFAPRPVQLTGKGRAVLDML